MLLALLCCVVVVGCQINPTHGVYTATFKGTTCSGEADSFFDASWMYNECHLLADLPFFGNRRGTEQAIGVFVTCVGDDVIIKYYEDDACLTVIGEPITIKKLACIDVSANGVVASQEGLCELNLVDASLYTTYRQHIDMLQTGLECEDPLYLDFMLRSDACTIMKIGDAPISVQIPVCNLDSMEIAVYNETSDCSGTMGGGPFDDDTSFFLSSECTDFGDGVYGTINRCSSAGTVLVSILLLFTLTLIL